MKNIRTELKTKFRIFCDALSKQYIGKYSFIIIYSFCLALNNAQTDIPEGDVSGTWTVTNSPYRIKGEIVIPFDSTLTIEPGVEVFFKGHYKFYVKGKLLAIGTKNDTIKFTAENKETGWHGIRFLNEKFAPITNDSSKIIYCSFKYGKANTGINFDRCGGAIFIKDFDKVLISYCLFDSNLNSGTAVPQAGPAIYVYNASPSIKNSTFSNNRGSLGTAIACLGRSRAVISNNLLFNNKGLAGSIVAYGGSSPIISGNLVFNNISKYGAGINAEAGSTPRIENNIIFRNQSVYGPGIFCWSNAKPIIINNTIVNNIATSNGGGVFCSEGSDPILINNIIYGNSDCTGKQIYIDDNQSDPHFLYCNIEDGKEGFGGDGAGVNYSGFYENNIDLDPMFLNPDEDNFLLSDISQCINAGIDSVAINGVMYHRPPFCISGNPRPSPAGSYPDIGACENALGTFVFVEQELTIPKTFKLYQNYPNPFNPSTSIEYSIPAESKGQRAEVKLVVYDILGREVVTLVNEKQKPGNYEVEFDGSSVNRRIKSGIYFYRLQAGKFVKTRKMLLLR